MQRAKENYFKLVGYSPHPAQQLFHDSTARFRVVVAGRRFGKSCMVARDRTPSLLDPTKPVRGWIVAPTYSLGEKEYRYIWDDIVVKLGMGPKLKSKAYNVRSGEMYIRFPWGSVVEVKSADHPDSLVGEGLDWVILAEAAKLSPNIWDKYLRPALADRHGGGDFVTTPEGYNYIHELYQRGNKHAETDWESFHFPSWCNPYVYPQGEEDSEIEEMRRNNYQAWFDQEIAALFTAFAGQIYDEFDPAMHVRQWRYNPAVPNNLAVDFGFVNPFVCLDIQVTSSDTVHVWREYYKTHESAHTHARHLREREQPDAYAVEFGVCDPADPGGKKTLEDEGVAVFYADGDLKDVQRGISEVKRLLNPLNPRLFIDPSCESLIYEMSNYRTKESLVGKNENLKEEPRKFGDHGCDALRYFVMQRFVLGAGYHLSDVYETVYGSQRDLVAVAADPDDMGIFTMSRREW